MKKLLAAVAALLIIGASSASAYDPKDILSGVKGALSNSKAETSTTETSQESSSSSESGILGAIGGFINNVISNNGFTVDDLVGTWSYSSPAVSFKSENALMSIGGAGAATALESKLEPYYNRLQLNKTTLIVEADHSFTLKFGAISLGGTVEKDNDQLIFAFSAFGRITLGKLAANATKAGSTLNLTFDATRLVQILTAVSGKLNISTLNTLSSLLSSYDGVFIGFKLKKQ